MRRIIVTAAVTVITFLAVNVLAQSAPRITTTPSNPVFNPNTPGQPGPNDVRSSARQGVAGTTPTGVTGMGGMGGQGGKGAITGTGGAGGGTGGFTGQGGFGGFAALPSLGVPYGGIPQAPAPTSTRRYDPLAPIDHHDGIQFDDAIDHVRNDGGI